MSPTPRSWQGEAERLRAYTTNPHDQRERDLMAEVRHIATGFGWRVYHTHDSRRSTAGFPDLVLVRGSRLVFAELKSLKGIVEPEQREWLDDLARVKGVEVWLVRPAADYSELVESLR
jgi:hypothetical protein